LKNDASEFFEIVDTIHAADWKPRQLKFGEAVQIATGASLPCENLRVVMQENIERADKKIEILRAEKSENVRLSGEEIKAGEILLRDKTCINAGVSALLATNGFVHPLVSPRLRVVHFTTGDEIISPEKIPSPGQIRDSNSILIRALLKKFDCDLWQQHLPENFEAALKTISTFNFQLSTFNLVLISGGASVGEKDFTRALLEEFGFEIIFNRVNLRPGAPLIFGVNGARVAFGLPGNPLSHFVCFHFAVASALAKMTGDVAPKFFRGRLTEKLIGAFCARETLWPARLNFSKRGCELFPLNWKSSSDVTCLAETNALVRVPPNQDSIGVTEMVEFLPLNFES
jgi:molybdopterin molybdotransferase